jgi:sugar phosphate permease
MESWSSLYLTQEVYTASTNELTKYLYPLLTVTGFFILGVCSDIFF